ncbi:pyridoxamine 5'-phosphate oxidase family protein [Enterococcus sp. CSURQ0835]|uniref:pyridoxamine 5'-phosphate oxidase family protein n=1 Tax=Enterococcus sp. CSURQ0835 TaxID=2681394 RepID=UPI001357CDA7|nr:pyridoxamine 5'-phosphate oxidase family protein [Enterococcus sp. CSURQ0835]
MFTDPFLAVLKHEGVVTIISNSQPGFHVVNTWNSYLRTDGDHRILAPAAGMHSIENDLATDNHVFMTVGSKAVPGLVGEGTGFHVKATAKFVDEGPEFDRMKKEFPFLTRTLILDVENIEQKI